MFFQKNFASETSDSRVRRRNNGVFPFLLLLLVFFSFYFVGDWLIVEDPLDHAQAIAVLSGRMPVRVLEAAKLYKAGYAPEIWLTRSNEPAKSLQAMGVEYYGEEYYNAKILIHEGVPPSAIRVLDPPIVNTADEMITIKAALNGASGSPGSAAQTHTVILVTSKPHTRRVRTLWRLLNHDKNHPAGSGDSRAIVRASSFDPFDPHHWWRTTSDALDVVREVLGLLNAWAGLPLTPSKP